MVLHRAVQKGAADIIGIKPAGSYLPAESVRKWMVFLSAQDESCQHPAQKIITAWRKAYSQSYESCQVFGSISVQMLFQTFAALEMLPNTWQDS